MIAAEVPVLDALVPVPGPTPALRLAGLVRDATAAGVERQALLLRLSRLSSPRRPAHHRRLLADAWAPLRRAGRVQVFDLPNGDLVAAEAPPALHLVRTRQALAEMLDAEEAASALALVSLPQESAKLLATLEEALGLATPAGQRVPAEARPALDPVSLAAAERALAAADIAPFLRRQWVCRLEPHGGPPEPLWEERRIALPALSDVLLPGLDLEAAPWLARRLRVMLDRRLLAGLARAEEMRDLRAVGLSPLLESITEPEFLRFDSLLPAALRGGVLLSLGPEEVLADPEGSAFLRSFCRIRGHRLALETASPAALALLPPKQAGFDLVALAWNEGLPTLGTPAAEALRAALAASPDGAVLTGVDRPAAIAWGWEMGIRLFRGRLIEQRRPAL